MGLIVTGSIVAGSIVARYIVTGFNVAGSFVYRHIMAVPFVWASILPASIDVGSIVAGLFLLVHCCLRVHCCGSIVAGPLLQSLQKNGPRKIVPRNNVLGNNVSRNILFSNNGPATMDLQKWTRNNVPEAKDSATNDIVKIDPAKEWTLQQWHQQQWTSHQLTPQQYILQH